MAKSIYSEKFLELFNSRKGSKEVPYYFYYPTLRLWRNLTKKTYYGILSQMQKRGSIKVFEKNNQRFVKLTGKGQLEILLAKAKIPNKVSWDGKWRIIMFDIPEKSREKRDKLRRLLKYNNYFKLQASVFISPNQLNAEAISYLHETGLIDYIRILRVDKMDNDSKLKSYFNL